MSIFTRWFSRNKKGMMETVPPMLSALAKSEEYNIPDGSMYHAQATLYQKLSWLNIAISITSQIAASVPLKVYKESGDVDPEVKNHALVSKLRRPNPLMSRSEFFTATFSYYGINGNAYWWLNSTSPTSEPSEIWVVPSDMIRPVPDEKMFIKEYEYNYGMGQSMPIPTWQIVHFKTFNPNNPFIGLSPIESIAVDAVADIKMSEYNAKFFGDNNARLPGILSFADNIGDPDWEKIKKDAEANAKRRSLMLLRNAGKGGVQWLMNTMTQKDMEFLNGRNFTKEEVFGMFAPGLSSILAINATEANAKTGKATLIDFKVYPMLCAMAEKMTNDLLPTYGDNEYAEFEDIRITDRVLELQERAEYSKVHTVNEIREKYDGEGKLEDERGELMLVQLNTYTPYQPEPEVPADESNEVMDAEGDTDIKADMLKWKRKALKAVKDGKSAAVKFDSDTLSDALVVEIQQGLQKAKTAGDVKAVFEFAGNKPVESKPDNLYNLIDELHAIREALLISEDN
jgi:HK97 family phage portal protein